MQLVELEMPRLAVIIASSVALCKLVYCVPVAPFFSTAAPPVTQDGGAISSIPKLDKNQKNPSGDFRELLYYAEQKEKNNTKT